MLLKRQEDGVTITIDNTLPTTSGDLTEDETWSGTVAITGDVNVPEGTTLTIEPGHHNRICGVRR